MAGLQLNVSSKSAILYPEASMAMWRNNGLIGVIQLISNQADSQTMKAQLIHRWQSAKLDGVVAVGWLAKAVNQYQRPGVGIIWTSASLSVNSGYPYLPGLSYNVASLQNSGALRHLRSAANSGGGEDWHEASLAAESLRRRRGNIIIVAATGGDLPKTHLALSLGGYRRAAWPGDITSLKAH